MATTFIRTLQDETLRLEVGGPALSDLAENFRIPVLLADVEGFSYREIADMLSIPIGTVMSRLHRGRKALQKALWEKAVESGLVGGRS